MAEKPPAWTPVSGQIGQIPIMLSRNVDAANVSPASGENPNQLADQIVRANQSVINRFVARQRQTVEISGRAVHKAVLPLSGMDAYYSNVQGLERLHYHVSPIALAPPPAEVPTPGVPIVPTPEAPTVPTPELLAPPEIPVVPEELKKPEPGTPDFLYIEIPYGLAVEFMDGVN